LNVVSTDVLLRAYPAEGWHAIDSHSTELHNKARDFLAPDRSGRHTDSGETLRTV
jgi:hypothetical protein